jgi:hypothetical protein
MKPTKLRKFSPVAIAAIGVVLGRGAQAATIIDFNTLPAGQPHNGAILQTFGDNASVSSPGVTVVGGGTPNIGLTWNSTGGRWDYYIDSVWSAGQLDNSNIGDLHNLVLTPQAGFSVSLNSFNFHPYYVSEERFTYEWSVLNGSTVRKTGTVAFGSDATKLHPVNIDFIGNPGEELTLQLRRIASTLTGAQVEGDPADLAIDDISFAQIPEPSTIALLGWGGVAGFWFVSRRRARR